MLSICRNHKCRKEADVNFRCDKILYFSTEKNHSLCLLLRALTFRLICCRNIRIKSNCKNWIPLHKNTSCVFMSRYSSSDFFMSFFGAHLILFQYFSRSQFIRVLLF